MTEHKVDVFISGAGPVGLLLTYQLARLDISTCIIDAADKASPMFPMYGRACTLFPRTSEMLDQLDLFDEMAQIGLIGRRSVTFKDGQRVGSRGWKGVDGITESYFDFLLNIRLKYMEDIFRDRVAKLGRKVQTPVKLVNFLLDENAADDYKVTSTCVTPEGKTFKIRSKYIVGCDGGRSIVREAAGIPFLGEEKEDHWVRIDGPVKTNMPDSRIGFGAVETKTHGHTLWVALDHGATRIGYVLNPEMYAKYGKNMKQEDAVKEAKAAMAPFEVEFLHVDWHTVYVIKQRVAERFQDRERILIAGDAAHVHSSGGAQGMNTGTHDAVSLGWRLAGVLKGWYKAEVLANYSDERRAIALQLIENDKITSALISGHKPEKYKDRPENVNVLFDEHQIATGSFTFGYGIEYPENILNDVKGSYPPIAPSPGMRAPDVVIRKNGFSKFPVRLYEVTKNSSKFHVVVFAGDAHDTRDSLRTLRAQVDELAPKFSHAVEFRTIIAGIGLAFEEHLGVPQFGDAYWDVDHSAHVSYKVSTDEGAILVLRPDGILGFVGRLASFDRVAEYLGRIIIPTEPEVVADDMDGHVGEMIGLDENNLDYKRSKGQDLPQSMEQGSVSAR